MSVSGLSFTLALSVPVPHLCPCVALLSLLIPFFTQFHPQPPTDSFPFLSLTSAENSFVTLDHSGILTTEFVSLLEETEFTILINAYPAPKVAWLKDGKAMSENYYTHTKTSHIEGNR